MSEEVDNYETGDIDGDRGEAYVPAGNLFVEEPKREGASHAVGRK